MGSKQMKMFLGMQHVKQDYANTGLSDSEFAKLLSSRTKFPYSAAEVRNYRATLGIANNKPKDERDQQILALKALCVSMMVDGVRWAGHSTAAFSPAVLAQYDELIEGKTNAAA